MTRLIATAALLVATGVAAQQNDECRFEAERSANIDANASDRLVLIARAGSLRVEGRAGLTRVQVRGRACASSEALLDQLRLETGRNGGVVRVEVREFDEGDWTRERDRYALLHLVLEVPEGMAADITDGSGETALAGLGRLHIDDGSGELTLENIGGDVEIDDGSGGITVHGVRGNVTAADGSGDLEVRDVTGSVAIDDGSGSIRVENVQGDLTVVDDGSGSIRHSGVQGRVRIPEKERNRRQP
jgi:hypothetical protein